MILPAAKPTDPRHRGGRLRPHLFEVENPVPELALRNFCQHRWPGGRHRKSRCQEVKAKDKKGKACG